MFIRRLMQMLKPAPPLQPAATGFEFIPGRGIDMPENISPPPQMVVPGVWIALPDGDAEFTQRCGRIKMMSAWVHIAHRREPTLESLGRYHGSHCPGCRSWTAIINRVRGNRPTGTWRASEEDERLIYEAVRTLYLHATRDHQPITDPPAPGSPGSPGTSGGG